MDSNFSFFGSKNTKCNVFIRCRGFTLVELLTVIAIIGFLVGLMLPAVQAARATARRLSCSNKMKQIGIAIHNYYAIYDQFPPSKWGIETPSDERIKHHILSFVLPYIEQESVYAQIDFSVNWNDTINETAMQTHLSIYHCPDAPRNMRCKNKDYFPGDYATAEQMQRTNNKTRSKDGKFILGILPLFDDGIVQQRGKFGLFGMLQPPTVVDYNPDTMKSTIIPWAVTSSNTDGLSQTMMFMECAGRPFFYETGQRSDGMNEPIGGADWGSNASPLYIHRACGAGGTQLFNCDNANEPYSFHVGGSNFLYGDGTVHYRTVSIHPETFVALFTAYAMDNVSLD